MSEKLINYFKNIKSNNKLGHAYLICNTSLDEVEDELNWVFSNVYFNKYIDIRKNEDILIVEPNENGNILVESIELIQDKMMLTSQFSDLKVYIISNCECLKEASANKLLKILEEPANNVYAVLISSNINMVISTIISRCQVLKFYNKDLLNELSNDEENYNGLALELIELIENKKQKTIAYYSKFNKILTEKEKVTKLLETLAFIYKDFISLKLNQKLYFKDNNEFYLKYIDSNTVQELSKKLMIVNNTLEELNNNLNINLLFDRMVIEVAGV